MSQLSLLSSPVRSVPDVPGLVYVSEYVSEDEARALTRAIDREPWVTDWRRRRQIYGVSYGADRAAAAEHPPVPAWLAPLAARVTGEGHLDDEVANVVVNEYLPGQGIGLHHDFASFGPTVIAISLGSACQLDLVDPETGRAEVLDVAPRSLWVLGGDARRSWKHGIAHRKTDLVDGVKRPRGRRISITMRTLRRTVG